MSLNFIDDEPLDSGLDQLHTISKRKLADNRIIDNTAAAQQVIADLFIVQQEHTGMEMSPFVLRYN